MFMFSFSSGQWESKSKEEPLPIFSVSFSGQLYSQNPLFVVSWGYTHSWFVAALAFLLPSPLSFPGVSGTFALTHTKLNQNNILTPVLPSVASETPQAVQLGFWRPSVRLLFWETASVSWTQTYLSGAEDGHNSQDFSDILQKWSGMGKTSSRDCPLQLSVSCWTVLEQTLLSITSYFARL